MTDTQDTPPTHHDIFEAFLSSVREMPIALIGQEGGKHSPAKQTINYSTLGEAPQPFMQIIDNAMRLALATPPLSNASNLVLARLAQDAYQHISLCMRALSPENEFDSAKARELGKILAEDFLPESGMAYQKLARLSGFYADIYDPIDLGTVSYPGQYNDIIFEAHTDKEGESHLSLRHIDDEPETPADQSMSWMDYQDDPLTLNPYVETSKRVRAVLKRLDASADQLFCAEEDAHISDKIAILHRFGDQLLRDAKQHMLSDSKAVYNQAYDLSPSSRTAILLQAIEIAADPLLTPDALKADLAQGSDLVRHLYQNAYEGAPRDDLIQLPAVYHKTIVGAKDAGHEDPALVLRQ